jgi:hypothetical protein
MSKIYVDEIAPKTSGNKVLMPQGGIIQLQYTQLDTAATQTFSANTDTAFTDLTVNITPTSTSSIIKLECHIAGEFSNDGMTWDHAMFFFRDTTALKHSGSFSSSHVGISALTRTFTDSNDDTTPEVGYYTYFDTPNTTSQVTYKVAINSRYAGTFYINTTVNTTDGIGKERFVSNIVATEIAG